MNPSPGGCNLSFAQVIISLIRNVLMIFSVTSTLQKSIEFFQSLQTKYCILFVSHQCGENVDGGKHEP